MKILILSDIAAPYRVAVFKGLSEEFDTTLFFNYAKNDSRNPAWYKKADSDFSFEILNNEKALAHYAECIKNIKDYDLVLCYDAWAKRSRALHRLCMRKRVPYVLNADGALGINMSFPRKQVKTFYVKRAAICFAGCQRAVEYFEAYGAKKKDIVKHPFTSLSQEQILGAPYTKEQKQSLKNELGIQDEVMLLTVGQFIPRKGFDLLLEAWAKTKQNCALYIIGGGPLESEYKQTIQDKNLKNVHIVDFKQPEELRKYYLASDMFVLPTREDIWGLVINEALASALPAISSNRCTAGNELIENDFNGYVYECEDTTSLAAYIDKLADDEGLREKFSKNALKAIAEYTFENIVKSHIDSIYKFATNAK